MAWLPLDLGDGTIKVDLASVLTPDASGYARGFIGIAFLIDAKNRFETIYLRSANSLLDDQIGQNHTIQHVAYPSFPFPLLRRDGPENSETYADIGLGEGIGMRSKSKEQPPDCFSTPGQNLHSSYPT